MLGKTAQETWAWGADPSKRAAVHCRESGMAGELASAVCFQRPLHGDARTTPESRGSTDRQEGAAFASGGGPVSLPAGATPPLPSVSFEHSLAKAILLCEEGVLPSA